MIMTRPLHLAAEEGNADVAKLLLSHGADVDAEDAGGETPLDHAVSEATAEMIRQHGVSGMDVRCAMILSQSRAAFQSPAANRSPSDRATHW